MAFTLAFLKNRGLGQLANDLLTKKQGHPTTVSSKIRVNTFRLCKVLLDLQKCILSGATKFFSVRSSWGN